MSSRRPRRRRARAVRNEVIKIWSRRSTILPQFVGLTFGVYNGHKHIPVNVSEEMIGQKFGEYSPDPDLLRSRCRQEGEAQMSKDKNPRRVADNEATRQAAHAASTSPRKS